MSEWPKTALVNNILKFKWGGYESKETNQSRQQDTEEFQGLDEENWLSGAKTLSWRRKKSRSKCH